MAGRARLVVGDVLCLSLPSSLARGRRPFLLVEGYIHLVVGRIQFLLLGRGLYLLGGSVRLLISSCSGE